MCQFIETIKIENGRIFLLPLHQQRLNQTLKCFGSQAIISLENILDYAVIPNSGLYKCRVVYDIFGNFQSEVLQYERSEFRNFTLVENNQIDYSFKFFNREELTQLKPLDKNSEIIITKNGLITDTSFSNLIFLRNQQWFTPETFLLNGVQRQNLLINKEITSLKISIDNLKEFSHFKVINAMNSLCEGSAYPLSYVTNLP